MQYERFFFFLKVYILFDGSWTDYDWTMTNHYDWNVIDFG